MPTASRVSCLASTGPGEKRRAKVLSAEPRSTAALVLKAVLDGQSLTRALPGYLERLPVNDRALASELAYGTCRWYGRLGAIASLCLEKPLRRKDQDIHALLLIGLYQLIYLRVPSHAAISETVGAARLLDKPWATGLLNGILRRFQRESVELEAQVDQSPLSKYALPDWLMQRLMSDWSESWESIAEGLLQRPPLTLRVNQTKTGPDAYQQQLAEQGLEVSGSEVVASALTLTSPVDAQRLPGFDQGLVSVQDAGAQLAAGLLEVTPGQSVLDACAAPGGKTGHLLEMYPEIHLTAVDIDQDRLDRVRENLARLDLSAEVLQGDAARPEGPWAGQTYDRILLDVPCSATGVMRRHPDIKLLRRETDIQSLMIKQQEILKAIWPLLRAGGKLLYATCSILGDENERQVEGFLQRTADARAVPIQAASGQTRGPGWQILPGEQQMDGFFYAMLEKGVQGK